ncbi:RebB family R body protein [Piscinibacter terrae]|uniref:Translation initiation factor 2 n=1 Tax=Piscinibacter terrae TaxID=2496871 RepID=A0A3N7HIP8_9BURK|nr:RebB family R body protein [Albitalea terrae]RQP21898.1 translation initiation factor 2 [Albitalea terrae]
MTITDDGTVNSQIVDSVSSVVTLSTGQAASQALGMLDAVLLETLGMAMYNAVNRQQSAGMISSAAITAACAKMLAAPFPIVPPPPPPGPPPVVWPLPGPPPQPAPSAAVIAAAMAEGKTAVDVLKAQALGTSTDAATAQSDLQELHTMTAPPAPPAPAPAPAPTPAPSPSPAPSPAPTPAPEPAPAPSPAQD